MSFSFGFSNEDFSDDEFIEQPDSITHQSTIPRQQQQPQVNPLDQANHVTPKAHTLSSLLSTLQNVRLTFDNYTTNGGTIIYRRELFDIKHQVMIEEEAEEEATNGEHVINDILVGGKDAGTDLKTNVYEGGFKSWECSYDTVDELSKNQYNQYRTILELGCGTALPSCFLLLQLLANEQSTGVEIILSDFNYEVLRLVTLPNLIIHWASTLEPQQLHELSNANGTPLANDEVLLTPALIQRFEQDLQQKNISLKFVSGPWGRQFLTLLHEISSPVDFIISSETIYSPQSLPVVAETILDILHQSTNVKAKALIAAKNIYFGVGGSVVEFVTYLKSRITNEIEVGVYEVDDTQLKRSMVHVYKK